MVCLVVPVALAIIPQAAGVVGADDGDCWINLALDKDDTFAWQIAAFQGWLVLAWLVAFVAVGWMACNITPMTGGWRAKILAFSLPVVVLVRTPLLVCADFLTPHARAVWCWVVSAHLGVGHAWGGRAKLLGCRRRRY